MDRNRKYGDIMTIKSKIKLRSGNEIPIFGFGTWQLKAEEVSDAIVAALDCNYIHLDTAQIYNNEYEIGMSLKKYNRSKIFITSKVWVSNFKNFTTESIHESLRRLDIDYLNLMLLHWPYRKDFSIVEKAYKELISARNNGLAKSIGVSNFTIDDLEKLHKSCGEWPEVNQIIFTPKVQSTKLISFCHKKGIVVEGYSLLRSFFGNNGDYTYSGKFTDKELEFLKKLSIKYDKTQVQIIIRWATQRGVVVFPKSKNPTRIRENASIFDFELTDQEVRTINNMDELSNTKQVEHMANNVIKPNFEDGLLYDTNFK